ncbi:MAG: serine/threonine-protein kinase [Gemmatales bacterium]
MQFEIMDHPMNKNGLCPADDRLEQFARGTLPAKDIDRIATHVIDCNKCSDRLSSYDGCSLSLVATLKKVRSIAARHPTKSETVASEVNIAAPPPNDGLRTLLRQRLLALVVLGAIGHGTLFGVQLFQEGDQVTRLASGTVPLVTLAIPTLLCLAIAVHLWRRLNVPLGRLRGLELLILATSAAYLVFFRVSLFSRIPYLEFSSPEHRGIYIEQATLLSNLAWYLGLVSYGLVIPNSGRRCAFVVSGLCTMALASLLVTAFAVEGVKKPVLDLLLPTAMGLTIAGSLAVFGSFRISSLQRQVAEANKYGPYKLIRKLGAGGMGEVHLAEHALLKRPCAIKIIRPERAGDPRILQRFEREVRSTARLTHPNTVEVYDYGRTADGTFFYVMEYLDGHSLEELIETHGPLPAHQAIPIFRQICAALVDAHAAGLVHRDVKPSNVMLCTQGQRMNVVKLLDFGLVRLHSDLPSDASGLTQEGFVLGTPAYMAPEQARGEAIDFRADQYSFGVLAFYILTGRPPFVRSSVLDILIAAANEPPPRLEDLVTGVPQQLVTIINRCLAKSPLERFDHTKDLAKSLEVVYLEG